ncbi:hypothetical protein M9H77_37298 [Catharanthus roseus]|uniref:Uncharacterized protein n=1 Tax=Catharanthus roseus TaxID=4058 RepID=A0ACB9ZW73_CATRO|nr:hypothetical protein M9H77_37298 [Catharanthus roseus]
MTPSKANKTLSAFTLTIRREQKCRLLWFSPNLLCRFRRCSDELRREQKRRLLWFSPNLLCRFRRCSDELSLVVYSPSLSLFSFSVSKSLLIFFGQFCGPMGTGSERPSFSDLNYLDLDFEFAVEGEKRMKEMQREGLVEKAEAKKKQEVLVDEAEAESIAGAGLWMIFRRFSPVLVVFWQVSS